MKILLIFGTRPEAIKMCPLVRALDGREGVRAEVAVTGQHGELLDGVLAAFGVRPDYRFSVLKKGQSLSSLTAALLTETERVLAATSPDAVLVHGDTATAYAAALAAFLARIPVAHVEAGLRSGDILRPYPEELFRRAISLMASLHFAPTAIARDTLLREGCEEGRVFLTGNTAIDALRFTVKRAYTHPILSWAAGAKLLLLTTHRRESLGAPMHRILRAVRRIIEEHPDIKVVLPAHPSPAVRAALGEVAGVERLRIIEPLDVIDFHNILARCHLVLTDSGGIQEEAPALGIPVLVLRDTTERPEGIALGGALLVGTDGEGLYRAAHRLLTDEGAYREMARVRRPYGDGDASSRIADILLSGIIS